MGSGGGGRTGKSAKSADGVVASCSGARGRGEMESGELNV